MKFKGKCSGDMECFCWDVTEDEYRRIKGERDWKMEREFRDDDIANGMLDDYPWRIYPSDVIPDIVQDGEEYEFEITVKKVK